MREIKFRAWEEKRKLMFMPNVIDLMIDFVGNVYSVDIGSYAPVNDLKVMQFTGLKDKNGKEIYEGDIYKRYDSIFVVIFDELGFKCKKVYDSWLEKNVYNRNEISLLSKVDSDYCYEVIGNIYENPELIKS